MYGYRQEYTLGTGIMYFNFLIFNKTNINFNKLINKLLIYLINKLILPASAHHG